MTDEQKKIALVAVAGGGGLILLLYLLRSKGGAGTAAAAGAGTVTAPASSQLPPGSNIVYNFPGLAPPMAVTAAPAPPACTKVCDECDDNSAYAGVTSYKVPSGTVAAQLGNFRTVAAFIPVASYPDIFAPVSLTEGAALGDLLYGR
jgi:hypothetical protein